MAITAVGTGTGEKVRRFSGEDGAAVLELVRADQLPGRPVVTSAVLQQALGFEGSRCEVLVSTAGEVLGAASWAVRAGDGAGLVLWLHCREDEQHLAEALIRHVLAQLGRRTVHAYTEPTVLAPAGLPVRNRPGTRRALEACGFSGTEHWRYLHHRLDTLSPRLYAITDLVPSPDAPGWQLHPREREGTRIGEALISAPVAGTTVLEWIPLAPERRHLGRILLEQCLTNLAARGIHHVTTCLDAPDDGPHREAVLQLHEAVGFTEIDQLRTYTRCP
ncbi:GNAT family N-acetyltransferase [Streptomyces sp. NPDC006283]|uniref:GNAT family N-acetyltransferase n=1 Tax=Streptomyces sp. NPDC006283 TaxID=3156741 RepID=UPI0033AE7062